MEDKCDCTNCTCQCCSGEGQTTKACSCDTEGCTCQEQTSCACPDECGCCSGSDKSTDSHDCCCGHTCSC